MKKIYKKNLLICIATIALLFALSDAARIITTKSIHGSPISNHGGTTQSTTPSQPSTTTAQNTPRAQTTHNSSHLPTHDIRSHAALPTASRALISEEPFISAVELASHNEGIDPISGANHVSRLLYVNFKYPRIRVNDTVTSDGEIINRVAMAADHLLVRKEAGVSHEQFSSHITSLGYNILKTMRGGDNYLIEIPSTTIHDFESAFTRLTASSLIRSTEPDFIVHKTESLQLNDPRFSEMWNLDNRGQYKDSKEGGDIGAVEAWSATKGSSTILVGIMDSGVDYNHEDLADNIWKNPLEETGDKYSDGCAGECNVDDDNDNLVDEDSLGCGRNGFDKNGVTCVWKNDLIGDDDENGFVDDLRGWNFYSDNNNPMDENGHGTHVAGTIGARELNGKGVVGVSPLVTIVPLKFLNSAGYGTTSDAIDALKYAEDELHVFATNNSWGGAGYSPTMEKMIIDGNALFIAAAGNESKNNDAFPTYPANIRAKKLISVGATDQYDVLSSFSNYGATKVDIAAPGSDILSTYPNNSYARISGTSMAAPHVTGAAVLLKAAYPSFNAEDVKAALLNSADIIPNLEELVSNSRRLNVSRSIAAKNPFLNVALEVNDAPSEGISANNDGLASPNETVALDLTAVNPSSSTISGAKATLALTNPDGSIEVIKDQILLPALPPGKTKVTASFQVKISPQSVSKAVPVIVTLTRLQSTARIPTTVRIYASPFSIQGSVTLDGAPFPDATILFTGRNSGIKRSRSDGTFSIAGPAGRYATQVMIDQRRSSPTQSIELPDPQPLTFALSTALKGRVLDIDTGIPVAGATLERFNQQGVYVDSWRTNASGDYLITTDQESAESFTLRVKHPGRYIPQTLFLSALDFGGTRDFLLKQGWLTIQKTQEVATGLPVVNSMSSMGISGGYLNKSQNGEIKEVAFVTLPDGSIREIQGDIEASFGRPINSTWISHVIGVNDQGIAVGKILWQGKFEAFVYSSMTRTATALPLLSEHTSVEVNGINNKGEIVGLSIRTEPAGFSTRNITTPTLWSPNATGGYTVLDIGELSATKANLSSFPLLINEASQISGTSINGSRYHRAFLYENNTMRDLGVPSGSPYSVAYALSSAGRVAGDAKDRFGKAQAFLLEGSTFTTMASGKGFYLIIPSSIHDTTRSVVGRAYNQYFEPESFVWSKGNYIKLQDLFLLNNDVGILENNANLYALSTPFFQKDGSIGAAFYDITKADSGAFLGTTSSIQSMENTPVVAPTPAPLAPPAPPAQTPPVANPVLPVVAPSPVIPAVPPQPTPTQKPVESVPGPLPTPPAISVQPIVPAPTPIVTVPSPLVIVPSPVVPAPTPSLLLKQDVDSDGVTDLAFLQKKKDGSRHLRIFKSSKKGWTSIALKNSNSSLIGGVIGKKKKWAYYEVAKNAQGKYDFFAVGKSTKVLSFGKQGDILIGGCDLLKGDGLTDIVAIRGKKSLIIRDGADGKVHTWKGNFGKVLHSACVPDISGEHLALYVSRGGKKEIIELNSAGVETNIYAAPADATKLFVADVLGNGQLALGTISKKLPSRLYPLQGTTPINVSGSIMGSSTATINNRKVATLLSQVGKKLAVIHPTLGELALIDIPTKSTVIDPTAPRRIH
jgi:probable HAF family extracellular repeat protein